MANMQWAGRIGRRLRLRDLHVLFVVAEEGSMAQAARRLAVSQPVVSQAIADLEHTLGVPLVDRHRKGVVPTLYGRALLTHSIVAFDALRQGVKELEFLADPSTGELRIGCPEWMMAGLVPEIIGRLARRYPRIVFHVQQTNSGTARFRELRQRSVDLVLGLTATVLEQEDLHADVLFQEQLAIVAGTNSRWAQRRKISLAELVTARWVLTPQTELPGSIIRDAFRASGVEPPLPAVSAFSIHLRNRLLATGDYLSVVPQSVLRILGTAVSFKALPVKLPIPPRPVAIVTLKKRTLSPVAKLFIDCARDVTKRW
jgi:DNA-binding transcriptional LysR family regulator